MARAEKEGKVELKVWGRRKEREDDRGGGGRKAEKPVAWGNHKL